MAVALQGPSHGGVAGGGKKLDLELIYEEDIDVGNYSMIELDENSIVSNGCVTRQSDKERSWVGVFGGGGGVLFDLYFHQFRTYRRFRKAQFPLPKEG